MYARRRDVLRKSSETGDFESRKYDNSLKHSKAIENRRRDLIFKIKRQLVKANDTMKCQNVIPKYYGKIFKRKIS